MASGNTARRLRNADLRVDPSSHPGWEPSDSRAPRKGDTVFCTEGRAEVSRVCGKTSDGSRLLELRILDRQAPPFYAASSNVLLPARQPRGSR